VTVFEKSTASAGCCYGIPDFKMEKHVINRRMVQMEAEGVQFRTSVEVGVTVSVASLKENFDAIVMAGGAEDPRPLDIPGFELPGVRFAMEFLTQQNKRNAGDDEIRAAPRGSLLATGKHVVVIGGGDTGSTASARRTARARSRSRSWKSCPAAGKGRQGAELAQLAAQAAHLVQPRGRLRARIRGADQARRGRKRRDRAGMRPRRMGQRQDAGSAGQRIHAEGGPDPAGDGLPRPAQAGLLEQAGVELDARGNVKGNVVDYKTSVENVFACGDMRRGQSLVVWAIREGRQCARAVDEALMGVSELPR
jgi:glutamate synthase (NADPH/NADH) small chain